MKNEKENNQELIDEIEHLRTRIKMLETIEIDGQTHRAYFEQLFENAPEGIILAENSGRIIHANKEFLHMFGYTTEEIEGKYVDDIVASDNLIEEAVAITQKAADGTKTAIETIRKRKDGSMIHVSILASPIIAQDQQIAVYAIYRDITERKQAVDNLRKSYEQTQKILTATIDTLARAAEKRDPYTAGHQQRVAQLARAIAADLRYPQHSVDGIYLAGVVHDIGKIHIPAEILTKPTTLTELELNIMKTHSQVGYEILKDIEFPWPIAMIILQHHERINGSGYPQEIRGNAILKESCIIAVADVVEAMSSHRPYRPARSMKSTLAELEKNRGILYDPEVVDSCLSLFRNNRFTFKDIHHPVSV